MILQLVLQIILPVFFLGTLWCGKFRNRLDWFLSVVVFGAVLAFSFVTARWDWFSYYLRVILVLLFIAATYVGYCKIRWDSTSAGLLLRWTGLALNVGILVVATWFNVMSVRGYGYSGEPIRLASPVRSGFYYVGGGGSSAWLNAHRTDGTSANDFAVDIVRLTALGRRIRGLKASKLTDYAIYGDIVHSPCTGQIIVAVDGIVDKLPPLVSSASPAGNHIVMACQGAKVVIAHLMNGSLTVAIDESVSEGQVIGRVGNSGNTSQPHLHIHAAKGGSATGALDGVGVPILLDGRFLSRNSLFNGMPRTLQE